MPHMEKIQDTSVGSLALSNTFFSQYCDDVPEPVRPPVKGKAFDYYLKDGL